MMLGAANEDASSGSSLCCFSSRPCSHSAELVDLHPGCILVVPGSHLDILEYPESPFVILRDLKSKVWLCAKISVHERMSHSTHPLIGMETSGFVSW